MTAAVLLANIEWGTAPDLLAAIGTVGALAVALVLFARDQEDRRRAQASRVVCWLEAVDYREPFRGKILDLVLHNGSEEPVFDCHAHVELDPAAPKTFQDGRRRLWFPERMLPPGQVRHPLSLGSPDLPFATTRMVFTDANNQRWQRSHTGRLSRLTERPTGQPRVGCGALWYGTPHR